MICGIMRAGRTVEATNSGSPRDSNSNAGRRREKYKSTHGAHSASLTRSCAAGQPTPVGWRRIDGATLRTGRRIAIDAGTRRLGARREMQPPLSRSAMSALRRLPRQVLTAGIDLSRPEMTSGRRGRVGSQQLLVLELGPQGGGNRMGERPKVALDLADLDRAGNDRGDDRMAERKLQRRGGDRNAVPLAHGLDLRHARENF